MGEGYPPNSLETKYLINVPKHGWKMLFLIFSGIFYFFDSLIVVGPIFNRNKLQETAITQKPGFKFK